MLARCCVTIHDLLKCGSTLSISLQLHTKKPNVYDNEFSINVKILNKCNGILLNKRQRQFNSVIIKRCDRINLSDLCHHIEHVLFEILFLDRNINAAHVTIEHAGHLRPLHHICPTNLQTWFQPPPPTDDSLQKLLASRHMLVFGVGFLTAYWCIADVQKMSSRLNKR